MAISSGTLFERMEQALAMGPDPNVPRIMLPDYPWLDQTQTFDADVYASGWSTLIREFLDELDKLLAGNGVRFELLQLKEKFGELRCYYRLHGASEARTTAVFECYETFEKRSGETCIKCGAPARMRRKRSWILPLCDRHV